MQRIPVVPKQGEINIHGYDGQFPRAPGRLDSAEAIKQARDMGGFAVINHAYFWDGIGFHGKTEIERAAIAGAIAIEKNGTEIPPQMYSPVRSARDAREFGLQLVTSGDAHWLDMYGRSGEVFERDCYKQALSSANPADAVRHLIETGQYRNRLHYVTPLQFLRFFSFGTSEEKKA